MIQTPGIQYYIKQSPNQTPLKNKIDWQVPVLEASVRATWGNRQRALRDTGAPWFFGHKPKFSVLSP